MNKSETKETKENIITLFFKGMLMGLFDLVPGISGGTIALITGIYEELIFQINNAFKLIKNIFRFKTKDIKKTWKNTNKIFLITLILGILSGMIFSVFALSYLLTNFFVETMSAITGIILVASILMIKKNIHTTKHSLLGAIGVLLGIITSILTPVSGQEFNLVQVALLGAITIIAMILPGISGALILLLLGGYEFMIDAIKNVVSEYTIVLFFAIGAFIGLGVFSNIIKHLLKKYNKETMSFLSCLMLGAILKPIIEILNYGNFDGAISFFALSVLFSIYFYKNKK